VATLAASVLQRSDLNDFLFADIGIEASGMTLSVLSALARQGSDPWGEAGRLAHLSKAEASDSLAHTIAAMPRSLWDLPAAKVIAARLIALLPARPARAEHPAITRRSLLGDRALPPPRTMAMIACVAIAVGSLAWIAVRPSGSLQDTAHDVSNTVAATTMAAAPRGVVPQAATTRPDSTTQNLVPHEAFHSATP
jgi:hypothetical protein